jgi:hypothetical protein
MSRLCLVALCVSLCALSAPAYAGDQPVPTLLDRAVDADVDGEREMAKLALRRKLRGARFASWIGLSMVVTSPAFIPAGREPGNYDFQGKWYEKAEYDRAYETRRVTSPVARTGLVVLGGFGLSTLATGVVLEMQVLRKLYPVSTTPGWLGTGLAAAGVTLMPFAVLEPTIVPWVSLGLGGVGVVVLSVQLGLNTRASRRLPKRRHEDLYLPLRDEQVRVSVVPTPMAGGGGLALVGVW